MGELGQAAGEQRVADFVYFIVTVFVREGGDDAGAGEKKVGYRHGVYVVVW